MHFYKYLILFTISLILINCEDSNQKSNFEIKTNQKSITLGDTLNLSISNPKNVTITQVDYTLDDRAINANEVIDNIKLGQKTITAVITYDGGQETITKPIKVFNNKIPSVYTYTIVNTYPHDINSYTQGLEFFNGELYESTGQKTKSKLRKVNFETGEVLKNINLKDSYFGEGLTILNDKIYQLTWQSNTGFVYDVNSFEKLNNFTYGESKEGWGLCNDGKRLYKSDGSEKIWLLNAETQVEDGFIEAYTEKGKIPSLNELEWINGKIYANIYHRNGVVIINPKNGAVEGVINFKPLKELVTQHDKLDVLNGIAYHPERETIFVTGKNWDKLFEVTIKKK